jgi:hypothetical protein
MAFMKDFILGEGEHAGVKFVTVHNGHGARCGYALIPPGHPWHGVEYDNIPADVHGGLTYSEADGDDWWIGFDCSHSGDAKDLDLPMPKAIREITARFGNRGIVRTQEYVEGECRNLCEQVASVAARY